MYKHDEEYLSTNDRWWFSDINTIININNIRYNDVYLNSEYHSTNAIMTE